MRRSGVVAFVVGVSVLLVACGSGGSGSGSAPRDAVKVDAERLEAVDDDVVRQTAAAVNAFGFHLQRTLMEQGEGGNVVTSPLSAALLLGMVCSGAGGATAEEMAAVLHLDRLDDDRLGGLMQAVTEGGDVEMAIANSLWADDAALREEYREFVEQVYGATLEEVSLSDPATVGRIDEWVAERTEGKIDQIAADLGVPDPNLVLVLLNAVYFKGEWTEEFDPARTRDSPFTLSDRSQVTVPMMSRSASDGPVQTAGRDGYQLLRLPYGDDERFAMELYLPAPDRGVAWLAGHLDNAERGAALAGLTESALDVRLPRFEVEWKSQLNAALQSLGMRTAFGGAADFSRMSEANSFLSTVVQKTYIKVDEQGTEAAAVTGGAMATSLPPSFTVDRPFLFAISDQETGAVLFLGAIEDPRG